MKTRYEVELSITTVARPWGFCLCLKPGSKKNAMNWGFPTPEPSITCPQPRHCLSNSPEKAKTNKKEKLAEIFFTLEFQSNFPHVLCLQGHQVNIQPRWTKLTGKTNTKKFSTSPATTQKTQRTRAQHPR